MNKIIPTVMVRNEEYWIYYVLKPLLTIFPRVILYDTGSTDKTIHLANVANKESKGELEVHQEYLGDDFFSIGNIRNKMREMADPEFWTLLVDGDEIWSVEELIKLIKLEIPENTEVVMATGKNVIWLEEEQKFALREPFSADRLFHHSVRWDKTDYPFEGHGLHDRVDKGTVYYSDCYYYHVRHLQRSSKEEDAWFRNEKRGYYLWNGQSTEIEEDWVNFDIRIQNPYMEKYYVR